MRQTLDYRAEEHRKDLGEFKPKERLKIISCARQ